MCETNSDITLFWRCWRHAVGKHPVMHVTPSDLAFSHPYARARMPSKLVWLVLGEQACAQRSAPLA